MPRSKGVSIADVARVAGVSRAAVSLVLNRRPIRISTAKRQDVLRAAKRLGFRPHAGAQRLARRKMDTIALAFPYDPAAFAQLYLFELTREITLVANQLEYDILLDLFHSSRPDLLSTEPGYVDGSILVWDRSSPEDIVRAMEERGKPTVVIGGGTMKHKPRDFVDFDLRQGSHMATQHLLSLGHSRIAFFAGVPSPTKEAGYRAALAGASVPIQKQWIIESGLTEPQVAEAVRKMLRIPSPPTAILATNDQLAVRIIKALSREGMIVPRDVSLVGFDDIEIASLAMPSLTTVRVPMRRIAELVVRTVIGLIEGTQRGHIHEIVPTELVVRESSGPPPPY